MAKYEVLRPIEHNGKLYLPKVDAALPTSTSSSHGGEVPVEASGVVELAEKEALALDLGQIPFDSGKPLSIEGKKKREREAQKKAPKEEKEK